MPTIPSGPGFKINNKNNGGRTPVAEAKSFEGLLVYATEDNPLPIMFSQDLQDYFQNSSSKFISEIKTFLEKNIPNFSKDLFPNIQTLTEDFENFKINNSFDYSSYFDNINIQLDKLLENLSFNDQDLKEVSNASTPIIDESTRVDKNNTESTEKNKKSVLGENFLKIVDINSNVLDIKKLLEDNFEKNNYSSQNIILQKLLKSFEKESSALENFEDDIKKEKNQKVENLFKSLNLSKAYESINDLHNEKELPKKREELEKNKEATYKKIEDFIKDSKNQEYKGITIPELDHLLNDIINKYQDIFKGQSTEISPDVKKEDEDNLTDTAPNTNNIPKLEDENNIPIENTSNNSITTIENTINKNYVEKLDRNDNNSFNLNPIPNESNSNEDNNTTEKLNKYFNIKKDFKEILEETLPKLFNNNKQVNSQNNFNGDYTETYPLKNNIVDIFNDNSIEIIKNQKNSNTSLNNIDDIQNKIFNELQTTNELFKKVLNNQTKNDNDKKSSFKKRLF